MPSGPIILAIPGSAGLQGNFLLVQTILIDGGASFDPSPQSASPSGPQRAAPAPVASALTDNFDDNSLDATKWNSAGFYEGATTGGTASETNQRLEATPTASAVRATGYVSTSVYDLTDGAIYVRVSNVAAFSADEIAYLSHGPNDNNYYTWLVGASSLGAGGVIIARRRVAGVNTDLLNIAYNATTHAWFRIRHQSSDNSIHFETAPSSASDPPAPGDWTDRASETFSGSLSVKSGKIAIGAALFSADASPGAAFLDGFNTATTDASTGAATGTSTAAAVPIVSGSAAGTSAANAVAMGIGSASGSGSASGVGLATASSPGSAAGTGSASGAGQSTAVSPGSASGAGTGSGIGSSLALATGLASGSGSSSAVPIVNGSASGGGVASGVGASSALSPGTSAGSGAASGVGQSQAVSPGSAAGTSTAAGTGRSTAQAGGSSAGVGAASATGAALAKGTGSAAGLGSASGISSTAGSPSVGSASGVSTAGGTGSPLATGSGSAGASSTVAATGSSLAAATGNAAATSTAAGQGRAYFTGVGLSAGFGVAVGMGQSIAQAVGAAAAIGAANAEGRVAPAFPPSRPAGRVAILAAPQRTGASSRNGRSAAVSRGRRVA
jgi:hypothetical protein